MIKKVAVSVGDLNGIGIELILKNHHFITTIVDPVYCIDDAMLKQAAKTLGLEIPNGFQTVNDIAPYFEIQPGVVDQQSGAYSYASFKSAVSHAKEGQADALCTLPIHKKAWEEAGVQYKGHTDALRDFFDAEAIMMLGCEKMYVALFTEHIPLKDVAQKINENDLIRFFLDFYHTANPDKEVAVLGLNPHAGDDGVLGNEENIIQKAVDQANSHIGKPLFSQPLVPDVAFTPHTRAKYKHYIAMYHDQGLAPLKALYFDEGINVSLNLPILRTSVDHGTAFDIAYKEKNPNALSYINAIKYIRENI